MIIKIPKIVRIGSCVHDVSQKRNLKLVEGCWGVTRRVVSTITVDADLPPAHKANTFLHEVMHMIDMEYSCGLDEDNIERIANGLFVLLADNLGIELDWGDIQ